MWELDDIQISVPIKFYWNTAMYIMYVSIADSVLQGRTE